jgi:uncharacterized protein YlxW (UPF0749 family)
MLKKDITIAVIFGLICLLLTIGICVQIKTVDDMTKDVGVSFRENGNLKDEYLKWKSTYDEQYRGFTELEQKLETIRSQSVQDNELDSQKEAELKKNNSLLGLTEVKGSGIILYLDDNRENNSINNSDSIIHEDDLLYLVNELFNTGADAVSINGHRITSSSSIVCDGNIIRINGEKTGVPLTISAIRISRKVVLCDSKTGKLCKYYGRVRSSGFY